jgi:hypothetical protein
MFKGIDKNNIYWYNEDNLRYFKFFRRTFKENPMNKVNKAIYSVIFLWLFFVNPTSTFAAQEQVDVPVTDGSGNYTVRVTPNSGESGKDAVHRMCDCGNAEDSGGRPWVTQAFLREMGVID